jgi:hypothetical protein
VKGIVADEKDESPIAGAAVIQKTTTNGIATGPDGSFVLQIQGEKLPVTLSISMIGYRSQEINVYDKERAKKY